MVVAATGAVRVGEPHEGVKVPPGALTCKPVFGAPGKAWLKAKPVNGMAALLVMVNVKVPVAWTLPTAVRGLGEKAMLKAGGGTVTVRLIAAAVALGAWLLLRVTAGLVRTPAVVAVT
jgi:hypothetical protein